MKEKDFGSDFKWGASTAAYQIEGGWDADGKGPSIWDSYAHKRGKIKTAENANVSCDFYHRYKEDISILKKLGLNCFRFSLSWSRIFPEGIGRVNQEGLDFYHRVIDCCLENGIEPWITLYHWDLPQALEDKGGWANRDILGWFEEYVNTSVQAFGDKVKHWMVMNEPLAFTALGYLLGIHAPGKRHPVKFFKAIHHVALCQSLGGSVLKDFDRSLQVGTTFSCSDVQAFSYKRKDQKAAARADAILNRLFLEPALGLGYPTKQLSVLKWVEKQMKAGDEEKLAFDFDFIGLQYYTREVVKNCWYIPFIRVKPVKPENRGADEITEMGWEVYPKGFLNVMKRFASYEGINKIIVTENGAAFKDEVVEGKVADTRREDYLKKHIAKVLEARELGLPVEGYFIWTLMDNFEWKEGYRPRFGLVHIDFETQKRTIKDSAKWLRDFLSDRF